MKLLRTLTVLGFFLCSANSFSQHLPPSYQPMFNEIVTNFETITGSNSISKGSTTLSVLDKEKIALKVTHKGSVKNLTFEKVLDEENDRYWVAANDLTISMVNKYEKYLTRTLEKMFDYSEKRSKE